MEENNMFFITKHRHNTIVEKYEKAIANLTETLNRKEAFERITEKLVDITAKINPKAFAQDGHLNITGNNSWVSAGDINVMASLDDTVPRYVDDVNGGRVIKQEATRVVMLDENGTASYGWTKQAPDNGKRYQLKETIVKIRK